MQPTVTCIKRSSMAAVLAIVALLMLPGPNQGHLAAAENPAPQTDDMIYRAQIEIKVCNRDNAGTDDNIAVSLNARNNMWLNYSHNDFEQNSTFTYDLMLERVRYVRDIEHLRIHKTGTDGLALQRLTLKINGRDVYSQDFGRSCHWLDNEDGHQRSYTISLSRLRTHTLWRNYRQPNPPTLFSRAEIVSRIEGIVGNALYVIDPPWPIRSVKWDHANAVKVSYAGPQSLAVHLDLEADVAGPDKSVDVPFNINLACHNGRMRIESTTPRVEAFGINWGGVPRIQVDIPISASGCPTIQVKNNGDVELRYPAPTPRPTPTVAAPRSRKITFQQGRQPTNRYNGATDTTLSQDRPTQNFGGFGECYVDGDDPPGSNLDLVTLLRWDLSAIPATSRVKAVWITLHVTNRTDNAYGVYGLSRNWPEAQATWRHYQEGQNWAQDGATGRSDRIDASVGRIGPADVGDRTFKLNDNGIALVQGWINGTIRNNGFVIADPAAIDGLDFYCSDAANSTLRPSLTVEYDEQ